MSENNSDIEIPYRLGFKFESVGQPTIDDKGGSGPAAFVDGDPGISLSQAAL
ncbi:hypothetical protein [Mesorhizobium wenxiniae]|uniref:hypothetical protein n=1 Tax=Mesorhizobium wenxiniae TaxID=2014805 RepID=UPI0013FD5867|nr:hypothetical protein [Mesorhizobium wenxiniae]